jgi:prophage maintenance system killer protein
MDLIKKHVDTVIVLGAIISSILWMNHKFNQLEKEIAIMKTVMFMQGHLPKELMATAEEK